MQAGSISDCTPMYTTALASCYFRIIRLADLSRNQLSVIECKCHTCMQTPRRNTYGQEA